MLASNGSIEDAQYQHPNVVVPHCVHHSRCSRRPSSVSSSHVSRQHSDSHGGILKSHNTAPSAHFRSMQMPQSLCPSGLRYLVRAVFS